MHKITLAALAALTVVAAVNAGFASPKTGFKVPGLDEIRGSLNPDRFQAALSDAVNKARHNSIDSLASAAKTTVRKTSPTASTAAALRSIQRAPTFSKKSSHEKVVTKTFAKLRNALQPSSIFKSKAEAQKMRSLHNLYNSEKQSAASVSRREARESAGPCIDFGEVEGEPTNEQMAELCTNTCCFFRDDISEAWGLAPADVTTLFCAKITADGEDYCVANFPTISDEPTAAEMATVCESPCRDGWVGLMLIDQLTSGRRAAQGASTDWGAMADWVCAKDGDDYCLLSAGEMESITDPPSAANLTFLCGDCAETYFSFMGETEDEQQFFQDLVCARDASENFCILNPPTLADSDNPTNAELTTVCTSDCRVPWITGFALEDDETQESDMTQDFSALATLYCTEDATAAGTYCAADIAMLATIGDDVTAQNLTYICSDGCKAFNLGAIALGEGLPAAAYDTAYCAMDGDNYCLLQMEQMETGGDPASGMPTADLLDQVCTAGACADTFAFWFVDGMRSGMDVPTEMDVPTDARRAAQGRPPPPTPAQASEAICGKGTTGQYCLIEMAGMRRDGHDGALTEEMLDEMCDPDGCYAKFLGIAAALAGDPPPTNEMAFLCARSADGYCVLQLQQAAPAEEASSAPQEDMIPAPLLDIMCGECITQLGDSGAMGLLGLLLFSQMPDGESGRRAAQEANPLESIVQLMCLRSDDGYCLLDEDVAGVLADDGAADSQLFDPLFGTDPAARKTAARQYCGNSCINSIVAIGIEMEVGTLVEECMSGEDLFAYKTLTSGCLKNGEEFCIETVQNDVNLGAALNSACGIDGDFNWDQTCSAGCKTAVGNLFEGWGCCAAGLEFPLVAEVETACDLTAPTSCEASGTVTMGIDVPNLKNSWLSGRLSDRQIRAAIQKDIGTGMNVPAGLVRVVRSAAKGNGASITCEIEAPSADLARSLLRKVRQANNNRRSGINVAFTNLATAIPAEERAAALNNPEAALTGAVDAASVEADGQEMKAIEAELEVEAEAEGSAPPRLASAAWLFVAAMLAALASSF